MSQNAPTSTKKRSRILEDSALLRQLIWKYRRWVGLGLLALIIVDILDLLPTFYLKWAVDIVVDHRPIKELTALAVIYFITAIAQSVCRYYWRMFLIRASVHAGADLREKYVHHLFGLSMSFFDRRKMGDLMSLATNDVEAIRLAMGAGLMIFADALFYLMTIPVAMFFLSPKLTLVCCLPMLLIPFIVLRNEQASHRRFEKVQQCFGRISSMVQEGLSGIRVVKAFAREDVQGRRMGSLGEEYVQLNMKLARIQNALGPSMDLCTSLGMVILLFVAGAEMIGAGPAAISLGTFVAFQKFIQKMVWPMAAVGISFNYYQRSVSSSYRIREVLASVTDVPDSQSPLAFEPMNPDLKVRVKEGRDGVSTPPLDPAGTHPGLKAEVSLASMRGSIEFKNLSFTFPGATHPVLKGISLSIAAGERVALVGSIGSGKSTLLSLIPRLYPLQRGMLEIDGIDINDWPLSALRNQIGFVSQDVFLFNESIQDNIAYGLESQSIVPSSIEDSTRLANIHDEISLLNSSYLTELGERGVNLSGGQRQRLTLARALVKKPAVLVMDDSLSSVDVHTEESILKSIRSRPGRNTELIAAHRISTVREADRIIVLESGKIVQMGSHFQLIAQRSGIYRKFFEQQQYQEDLENYQNEVL